MSFFTEFPSLGRADLSAMRRFIDGNFKEFTRWSGEALEAFFNPLLKFLVWFEDLLQGTPWPIILIIVGGLAWLGSTPSDRTAFVAGSFMAPSTRYAGCSPCTLLRCGITLS